MKKFFKLFLIGLLVIGFLYSFYWIWKKSQPVKKVYEIENVEQGNIENSTVATGTVSPRDEVLIKPQISGIVSAVMKEAGQKVKSGDIIATVKVIPEMASLNSAESRVNVAQISLNLAQTTYERQKQLFAKGVISQDEMDNNEADYKKAKEEMNNSRDNLDIVKNGISKKTAQYNNTQIRSTITGTILDVPIKVGNSVIQSNTFNDGTTIATVANMNDLIFIGNLDETAVGHVHVGMPVDLSIGALDDRKFDATLEYIAPKGVETNGAIMFQIKAAVSIPDSVEIRAGYSANAKIILTKAEKVLTIPESCVSFRGDSAFAYVLKQEKPEQLFDKKQVTVGISDGIKIEIKSGLKEGDRLRAAEVVADAVKAKDDKK